MAFQPGFNASSNKLYQFETNPWLLSCNFIVDSTNGNGFGVRSLKGPGIARIYMHTTAAFTGTSHTSTLIDGIASGTSSLVVGMPVQGSGIPAGTTIASIVSSGSITLSAATSTSTTGSITYQAVGSPNPASGIILAVLSNNYNRYLSGFSGQVSPVSGTPLTSTTANVAYVIVSLGTATLAQWRAKGFPVGMTPSVGAAFIATATGTIGGSAAVEATATAGSGIDHIELLGDPNATLRSSNVYQYGGGQIISQCFFEGAVTAPAPGTGIGLNFYLSNSSVTIKGQ